jgi:hypothetical protein
MAAHKGPASLRPRCTRSGSSVAAVPIYQLHSFLISTLNRVSDQLHGPGCFITDEAQLHPMNRGWVGPTASLKVVNTKTCCPCRESKYDSSTAHQETYSSYRLLKYFGPAQKYEQNDRFSGSIEVKNNNCVSYCKQASDRNVVNL